MSHLLSSCESCRAAACGGTCITNEQPCCMQGLTMSDAMIIPTASQRMDIRQPPQFGLPRFPYPNGTAARIGPTCPTVPGSSFSRQTPMGASPFGRSIDMVDMCAQMMNGRPAEH